MKAYVIKNKEGRYYRESDVGLNFTTILSNANMYIDKIDAEMWIKENLILKGCKVQEITVAEGDLEKALELASEKLAYVFGECPYSNMNLQMPNYCDEECANNEKYLCWDKYFIQQAKESERDDL